MKKHIDTQSPADPNGVDVYQHFFYNAAWQVLETREADSVDDGPESLDPQYQFVWSPRYIDAPILRDENKDANSDCISGTDERLYYLTDAQMNVTCLVDTDGDALERYVYDPYGKVTIYDDDWSETRSVSSYANPILFAGYYRDDETHLLHVRNRMYHPPLGRWLQRDPIEYEDGMNLYQYVRSAPVGLLDPEGTQTHPMQVKCPKDKNIYGYAWEQVDRPSDSQTIYGGIEREKKSWLMGAEWQWKSQLEYEWMRAKGVGALQGNCHQKLTLQIGFSVEESHSLSIQGGGDIGKVTVTGGLDYTWGSSTSSAGSQEYGPTPCYEYLGIPLVLQVEKWTRVRQRRYGGKVWGQWSYLYYGGDKDFWGREKPLYERGGFLVCRRKCKSSVTGE